MENNGSLTPVWTLPGAPGSLLRSQEGQDPAGCPGQVDTFRTTAWLSLASLWAAVSGSGWEMQRGRLEKCIRFLSFPCVIFIVEKERRSQCM